MKIEFLVLGKLWFVGNNVTRADRSRPVPTLIRENENTLLFIFSKKQTTFAVKLQKRLRSLMDKMIDSDSVDMGSIPVEATKNKNNSLVINELFFLYDYVTKCMTLLKVFYNLFIKI